MSLADLTRAERTLHAVGKGEQTEGIGDAGAGAADALGDGRLRQPEVVDKLAVGGRLLQRREVGAHILDQRQLQHGARDGVLDDGGHRAQPARRAARQRRSPAMRTNRPRSGPWVTTSGWITPCTRIEAASVSSASGSISMRG